MKKLSVYFLTFIILLQQMLSIPFTVIAESFDAKKEVTISQLALTNDSGEEISEIDRKSPINLSLDWQTESVDDEIETIISLPEQLEGKQVESKLIDDDGNEVGTYIVSTNQITLLANSDTVGEGTIRIPLQLKDEYTGEQNLEFMVNDTTIMKTVIINSIQENHTESSGFNSSEETDKVSTINENTSKKINESSSETIIPTVQDTSGNLEYQSKAADITAAQNIDDQITFSNVKFTDGAEQEYGADYPYNLDASPIGKLYFDWELVEQHSVQPGDTYTFNLPSEFDPVAGTNGLLGEVGTWTVNADGLVTFEFNESVVGDNVNGNFWFEITLDEQELDESIEQEIAFENIPDFTIDFPVTPKGGALIDKKGTINNEGFNSSEAYWTVDINTALNKLVNATVTDNIPENMTYKDNSMEIILLQMNPQGDRTEQSVLDPSKYSIEVNEEGNPVVRFNDLNQEESKQAYRLNYTTEIVEPSEGFDGTQTFTNKAVLENNNENYPAESTVSSGFGKAIEKLDPEYNSETQTFDWTINYNYNQKYIDSEIGLIKDSWDPVGVMELEADDLSVYPVSIDENGEAAVDETPIASTDYQLTINPDKSGFELNFAEDIDQQAYQIKYKTKLLGSKGTGIVDNNGTVSNTVETGTERTDGSSGRWTQQGVIKRRTNLDIEQKKISWRIDINKNGYLMENLVLTDVFTGDGLSLIENTANHSGFEFKIVNALGEEFTGYTLDANSGNGFILEFTESINEPLTIEYTTHFERNSDGTGVYNNSASIDWREGDTDYTVDTGNVSGGNTKYTASNGVKFGTYNATTQRITWEVNTNYARLPIQSPYRIEDQIPENQEIIEDSITVYSYEVNQSGDILNKTTLNSDAYRIDLPTTENNQKLAITLEEELLGTRTAVGISFDTKFEDDLIQDSEVANQAFITNGENTFNLDAEVPIPYGGEYGDKFGEQAGEANERADWTVYLNPNRSRIRNFVLTDNPDLNSVLLEDTFRVYEASVDQTGKLTKTDNLLEEDKDYTLSIETDNTTGNQEFVLSFNDEITEAYILEYSSFIDPLTNKGESISNTFKVEGLNVEVIESSENEVDIVKSNVGGGSGSSIRGSLALQKTDESENKVLQGAVFELLTEDGSQVLRVGETDSNGELLFGGLRGGTYLLRETKAPDGYIISDELAEGMSVTLNNTEENQVTMLDLENSLTKVNIEKVGITDSGTSIINDAVTYNIYDSENSLVREEITTLDGTITVEDLEPGNYFIEEVAAPDGYIRNTERVEFTISINSDGTQTIPTIEVINYQGSVEWYKLNEKDEPLSGAVFEITGSNGFTTEVTSDENGLVEISGLAPGEYTVNEITAPEEYILNTEAATFTIENESPGEPSPLELNDFVNYQGKVKLVKTNDRGEPLSGAEFTLLRGESVIKEKLISDTNGEIFVEGLVPGEYSFIETAAPEGYVLNKDSADFTINPSHKGEPVVVTAGTFLNYKGSVELNKIDTKGRPLAGAEFEIRDSEGNLIQENLISDEFGKVLAKGLEPGEYSIQETAAPEGYLLNTRPIKFEIVSSENGEVQKVDVGEAINYQGSVRISKSDSSNNGLQGAVFEIRNIDGEIISDELMTDDTGQIVADGLAPGEYKLHEIAAPKGYIVNTLPISFTIDEEAEGEPDIIDLETMVNYKGSVEWQKITEDGEPLAGAEFKVFNQDEELVTTVNSDENGMVQIGELGPGTYTVQETSTIEGYILNSETFDFTIDKDYRGKPESIILDQFKNYQGKVQLIKMTDSNEPLAGAVFDLLRDDEVIKSGLTTDENGQVFVEDLIPGNYSFTETSAPEGFILNTQPLDFEIKSEIKGEPAVLRVGDFVNYRGSIELEKVDIKGNPLAGAIFEVRDSMGNIVRKDVTSDKDGKVIVEHLAPGEYVMNEVQAPAGYLINSTSLQFTVDTATIGKPDTIQLGQFFNYQGELEILKLNEDKDLLENAVFDIYDEEGNRVAQDLSTNQEGSIILSELAPGNYSIVETKAPDGYRLNSQTYAVTIPNVSEGKPKQVSIEIINKKDVLNEDSSDISNGFLPQMNTSSYQLIIALVAIGFVIVGITLFRKKQKD